MKKKYDFRCEQCHRRIMGLYHKWRNIKVCDWCRIKNWWRKRKESKKKRKLEESEQAWIQGFWIGGILGIASTLCGYVLTLIL